MTKERLCNTCTNNLRDAGGYYCSCHYYGNQKKVSRCNHYLNQGEKTIKKIATRISFLDAAENGAV